jgi:PAS domain S-box-containing protein
MIRDKSERPKKPSPENPQINPTEANNPTSETMLSARERISGERYQAFVDNIQEGVYELDIHGNFVYFNDSLCKIIGYPRHEIQFQNFAEFMDKDEVWKGTRTFKWIYQTDQGVSDLILRINVKEGSQRIVELSANLITNRAGGKIGFRGIVRDITGKFGTLEALRKSERRFRTLLDFVPYPVAVFTMDGDVSFLNPAFTESFGWTLKELEGAPIPYIHSDLDQETGESKRILINRWNIPRLETQLLTKDGRIVDVILSAAVFSESEAQQSGQVVVLRDITQEKRTAQINETLRRIGMALPKYPDLEGLLDYINWEVKTLLGVEGALIFLLDQEKSEFYCKSAAHEDSAAEKRVKDIRFPADKGVAGEVLRTGKPIIVPDTSKDPNFYSAVDKQAGFKTPNMLDVPLRSKDRIIGVLCAIHRKSGTFDKTDVELLSMIAGTVELSVENARFSNELKEAYEEVKSLNRAKDKVINRLSHELKTPLAVLSASLDILANRLSSLPEEEWQPAIKRAKRNLERILEIQYQVEDIMRVRHYDTHYILSRLVDECVDEMEALVFEEIGEGEGVERIRRRIDEVFGSKKSRTEVISLDQFVTRTIEELRPSFSHRNIDMLTRFEPTPAISMPLDPLKKVVVGLVKNAIENTPDQGKIEISIHRRDNGVELSVRDYGVGITADNQRHIFEGFNETQETMDYSSKRSFDFNAGGKGTDLLRIKIFSERYNFKIDMTTSRCRYIPYDKDVCPGKICHCDFCETEEDCYSSGGTTFAVFFLEALKMDP